MGETDSVGQVTAWDPPRRFAYEEDLATLLGRSEGDITPLATEFLVEAQSGGTCVVRVVSSAFGTGADWEDEFFEELGRYWPPFFDLLRLYAARFAGERPATRTVEVEIAAPPEAVHRAMARALGVTDSGQPIDALGLSGTTLRVDDPYTMFEVADPAPGYAAVGALPGQSSGQALAQVRVWLFGETADNALDAAEPQWQAWLDQLAVPEAVKR
jgi:hypothetical protein